jgi:hypothetical protein
MAKETISLVSDEELRKLSIQQRLQAGEITHEVYNAMTPDEQQEVVKVLFESHENPIPVPHALSGLEFAIFALAKIFFKKDSGAVLTADEQAFYDRFKQMVDQHELTLDANSWYIPYAESKMLAVKQNREDYKLKKIDITGSF